MGCDDLIRAVENAAAAATRMPVQRTVGAGYAVQADMMVGIPWDLWAQVQDEATRAAAE